MKRIDKREVKRLAALGLSQGQIARRLKCGRSAISQVCSRCRIKTQGNRPEHRSACGRANALRGNASRLLRGPIAAAKSGWPQARTRKEAELLHALFRGGPQTLRELVGRRANARDYGRITRLHAAGLVVRAGKQKCPGSKKPHQVWALAPGVRPGSNHFEPKPQPHPAPGREEE